MIFLDDFSAGDRCTEFWSEDLADGQTYCGVKVVNPFKEVGDEVWSNG